MRKLDKSQSSFFVQEIINFILVAADIAHHLEQLFLVLHLIHPEHLLAYFGENKFIVLLLALHLLFLLLFLFVLLSHVLTLILFALLHEVPKYSNLLATVFLEIEPQAETITEQ